VDYLSTITQIKKFTPTVGNKILEFYAQRKTIEVTTKSNATPLTQADTVASQMIVEYLNHLTPDVPVLSEEGADIPFSERKSWDYYWLVDPLDGTREFLEGTDEFTVNIALIHKHKSVLGFIYQPTTRDFFYAATEKGVWWEKADGTQTPIHARKFNPEQINVLISRHHTPKWLTQRLENSGISYHFEPVGSSLKFCRLAAGVADMYPRGGPTSEWDTAAGQCILEQAGGLVLQISGDPLTYNKKESLENPSFMAIADKNADWPTWLKWFNERMTKI
jgi:3'(2'), 5'-bisphosphate nucleotidase